MTAERRLVFALGERLHMSAAAIEGLSAREVSGWAAWFFPDRAANDDDAVPLASLTREQLRRMYPDGR